LQIRYSDDEEWSTVLGEEGKNNLLLNYVFKSELQAGELVQARYRCVNEIG